MKLVFVGAGELTVITTQLLLKKGFDVVIIEKDQARIDEVSQHTAAAFIRGDGSKPDILREASPRETDLLFCLTGNDQYNIIASLVGRSLGYKRVVTRIEDPAFQHVCIELGLEDVVVPDYTIGQYLVDLCQGKNSLQSLAAIRGDARIFSFVVKEGSEGSVNDLGLPKGSKAMIVYRDEEMMLAEDDTQLKKGDEVIVIAHEEVLPKLEDQLTPTTAATDTPEDTP